MNAKKKMLEMEELVPESVVLKVIDKSQTWMSRHRDVEKLPYYKIGGEYKYLLSEVSLWRSRRKKN